MPSIDLDFGSVGKVPEGYFRLVCDEAEYKQNKSKDGYIINLKMHLTDMPEGCLPDTDLEYASFENSAVYDNPSLKPTARWRLQKVLAAFTGEDWEQDGMKLTVVCDENCDQFEETGKCEHKKLVPLFSDATAVGLIYADDYNGRILMKVNEYLYDDGNIEFGPKSDYSE
jgi:hypothetical protein